MSTEADILGLLIEVIRAAPNVGGLILLAAVLIRQVDRDQETKMRLIERCYDLPEKQAVAQAAIAENQAKIISMLATKEEKGA